MKLALQSSLVLFASADLLWAQTAPVSPSTLVPSAPPAPPPILSNTESAPPSVHAFSSLYSIGDPTPEEQLYVEFINRARANPQAEAQLFAATTDPQIRSEYNVWQVDLNLMIAQFAQILPAQPLAINPLLTQAARRHTADMFAQAFQGHTGSDGTTAGNRVGDTGYPFATLGENVYANAESVPHGHAGFDVDWGPGPGGMQSPPGHRNSIHNAAFREIGVGVILGSNSKNGTNVGPQLVTQELAAAQNAAPFITGVAYYDVNGNGFYDIGEGIGGVTVTVAGASSSGVTALSGGYAVPAPGNGSYIVSFSGNGFNSSGQMATVSNQLNQKVDFVPAYDPPKVTGPVQPKIGRANTYTLSAVNGAMEYGWRFFERIPARPEGAENGTANLIIDQTAGYDVIQNSVKSAGVFAFHLAHPSPRPQSVTLNPTYLLGASSSLTFQSRLGVATPDQHARVQISTDNGLNWQTIYSQDGAGQPGETGFNTRSVSLAPFAGRQARLRFVYDFASGSFFNQTSAGVGWYFDDIQLAGTQEISNQTSASANGTAFQFSPDHTGSFTLQGRARAGHLFLDWGPTFEVTAVDAGAAPVFQISHVAVSGGDLRLTVEISSGDPGPLTLESKAAIDHPWSSEAASVSIISSAEQRLTTGLPLGSRRFYRVKAP